MLIRADYAALVDAKNTVVRKALIAIDEAGVVVGVHQSGDVDIPPYRARTVVELGADSLLIPGLINAHTHSAMTLMRGFGDDMKLMDWLVERIWPAETLCVSPEYVADGTKLAVDEMLRSGTTTFSDMYFFPADVERVAHEMGMRSVVGQVVIGFPTPFASGSDECLSRAEEALEKKAASVTDPAALVAAQDLVTYSVAPHAPYSVSEAHMSACIDLARRYKVPFTTHLHECFEEIRASVELDRTSGFCHQCAHKCRPLANLARIDLLDSSCVFAHMTQLEADEIELIARKGCHVVHCPSSNMKLASGFCQVAKLLAAGVNVALGTDGAASNNSLDMLAEMKLAALLGKGVAGDPTAVSAHTALRMATINGARALGLDAIVGSIEVGKRADFVALDLSKYGCSPVYDPVSTLVYSAHRDCVTHVWVNGKLLIERGQPTYGPLGVDVNRWRDRVAAVKKELDTV